MEAWSTIAAAAQKKVLDAIPAKWTLAAPPPESVTDVTGVPAACGLLTAAQLAITEQTADALVPQLARGALSAVEVVEAFCARAAIAHQCVNCLEEFFHEEALARAAELDTILKTTGKPVGPLHGLPVAIKDHLYLKGHLATAATVALHDNVVDFDGSIVTVLKNAGAIPFCKTTMPQTGMMLQTVSPLWGRTLNPFNRAFVSGGSSGGDGALVAMHGSPFCSSTDIGGSIRAPATFNGLYGIKPTAERIPKVGMLSAAPGQISIKISSGPICHSMATVKLVTQLLLAHYDSIGYDPTCVPFPWQGVRPAPAKLCFGVLRNDGVVTPQPPVQRAINEAVKKLEAAGHTVIEFTPPMDLWEVAEVTWKLYFQTGAKEVKALSASCGEPMTENFTWYLDTFKIKELTVPELFANNTKQAGFKQAMIRAWRATAAQTGTGRPIDGLVCPCAPSAGFPHEFPVWWGYYSLWNILDYPTTILPMKGFKISAETDPKDPSFVPKTNTPFDKMNYDIYDPEKWKNQPMCIQVVTPTWTDEQLLSVSDAVDAAVNGV